MNVQDPAPDGMRNLSAAPAGSSDDALPIYEVARQLGIAQHVLRTWENRFPQLQPIRGPSGRRLYRPDDVALLRRISDMLYVRHLSLGEVQRILTGPDVAGDDALHVAASPVASTPEPEGRAVVEITDVRIEEVTIVEEVASDEAAPTSGDASAEEGLIVPAGPEAMADAPLMEDGKGGFDAAASRESPESDDPPVDAAQPHDCAPETPMDVAGSADAPVPQPEMAARASTQEDISAQDASATVPVAQAEEDEAPLEQLVMLELERLRAENTALRENLRGILVELQALREMVPV
ncbi:transcriptional regulator [Novacetimonas pomaceti]|uniref:Transcriptional regulator n=2 Tax=Novacetimonas pomaceti TaxID=2021998 RepID=A0ABX5P418_9PROT|nr:transcriptional regulator [Novacetimonas pomaceti]